MIVGLTDFLPHSSVGKINGTKEKSHVKPNTTVA